MLVMLLRRQAARAGYGRGVAHAQIKRLSLHYEDGEVDQAGPL